MLYPLLLTVIAGLSTLLGGLAIFFVRKTKDGYLGTAMGFSAGVMIFISFVELLKESIEGVGYVSAVLAFFVGMLVVYLIDVFVPHSYKGECAYEDEKKKRLKHTGIVCAIGIAIHNFPEGIAVFFSSVSDISLGITIALAIALHNIPEGIAVAMPIFYATGSRAKAFWYSFLAGIAEPIGALLAFVFLFKFITPTILDYILGAVAGIMIFISFDELLPYAYEKGSSNRIILGIFAGMAVMALSLYLI